MRIRAAGPSERKALTDLHRRSSYVWEEDRAALDAHPDVFGVDAGVVAGARTVPFYERLGFVAGEPVQTRFAPAVRMWWEP